MLYIAQKLVPHSDDELSNVIVILKVILTIVSLDSLKPLVLTSNKIVSLLIFLLQLSSQNFGSHIYVFLRDLSAGF